MSSISGGFPKRVTHEIFNSINIRQDDPPTYPDMLTPAKTISVFIHKKVSYVS